MSSTRPTCRAARTARRSALGVRRSPSGRSSRSSRGRRPGRSRRSPHGSPGPGRAYRRATITQTVPRRLHSMQTLCAGCSGRLAVRWAPIDLEQLALVDRAAAQLEVDRHVRGDRGRGRQRRDVVGAARRRCDVNSVDVARSCAAPGCRPAVAQAPIVTSTRGTACGPRGCARASCGGGDGALDERQVVGACEPPRWSPPGSRRSPALSGQGQQLVLAVEQAELAAVAGRELPDRELGLADAGHVTAPVIASQRLDLVVAVRPARRGRSAARAELAVAAEADAALHVALHRDVDALSGGRPRVRARGREAHHHLGPAQQRDRAGRVERGAAHQAR